MPALTCPECGETKQRIAQHWAMGACDYPEIDRGQRHVLDGLMLSGATIAGNGNNRHLMIGTTIERLAEWTADRLDWLAWVRDDPQDGDRDDIHRVRTAAHPAINRYESWDKLDGNSGRRPPEDHVLRPETGRVWWGYTGGLEWPTDYSSGRTAAWSAKDGDKAAWIVRVLSDAGFDPTPVGKRVQLSPAETTRWIGWIGGSVPGVEHKWESSIDRYRELRD